MDRKARARGYVSAVSAHDARLIEKMIKEDYIQHNPRVATGRAPFLALIPRLAAAGSRITNIRMIEDGPFIVMQHRWHNAQPFGYDHADAFHILRFDDDGLIAEHWNVMQAATDTEAWGEDFVPVADLECTARNKASATRILLAEAGCTGRVHRVFGEGDTVVGVSEQGRPGERYAKYDLFLFTGAKLAGRLSVNERVMIEGAANQNTMFNFAPAPGAIANGPA